MNARQAHRGPDGDGWWERAVEGVGYVGLASRRLAILDLSPQGQMPMISADGNTVLVYNGEIYNCLALRAELEQLGCKFRSRTDTEVVLHSYRQWGPSCVRRFNGMFAFALWDVPRRRMMLARDHFGIKPLYYSCAGGRLAFASELKSLLKLPGLSREIDFHALHQYLSFLWVPEPATMFRCIGKLPAGNYAIFEKGEFTLTEYWDLEFPSVGERFVDDEQALAEEVRRRFQSTVSSQLLSDVPVGAFLSAGMDSSSIVACMAAASSKPVHTYTISFPFEHRRGELSVDDTAVAARTAKYFGSVHTDISVEPNAADLLPKLIWHMDEPVADPALITAFLINQEARKSVTVLLSGIGGDEIFGGYRKYQAHYLAQTYKRLPLALRHQVIEPLSRALPSFVGSSLHGYARFAKKMLRSGSLPPQERFIMDSVYFEENEKQKLYSPDLYHHTVGYDPRHRHLDCFAHVAQSDFLNQMLYLDTKMFLPSLNLNYNDKMSMASSAEVRVPFLDWEFAQWVAANVPPSLKIKGKVTKHILREAMKPMLPPEVLVQAKAGFGAPVGHWLRKDLRPMISDLLSPEALRRRGLFDPDYVLRMIDQHNRGEEDRAFAIWQLLTLELWMRTFVD
jgi:asparagine synthase (glutamine-hydrolysing)